MDGPPWVEAEGTALPHESRALVDGPLSGRSCLLYEVELGLWHRLLEPGAARETVGSRFLIQLSPSGTLLVDPSDALIRFPWRRSHSRKVRLGRDADLDARIRSLYRRLGRGDPHSSAKVRCVERRMHAGDRVQLAGRLHMTPAAGGQLLDGYRNPPLIRVLCASELVVL
jgi:hypothetical protein